MSIVQNTTIGFRMAYVLFCFEKVMENYKLIQDKALGSLVEECWKFTSTDDLSEWLDRLFPFAWPHGKKKDTMPPDALEMYNRLPYRITQYLDIIFNLGFCEIYTSADDNSSKTLIKFEEFMDIFCTEEISVPDIGEWNKPPYLIEGGDVWGKQFTREQFLRDLMV